MKRLSVDEEIRLREVADFPHIEDLLEHDEAMTLFSTGMWPDDIEARCEEVGRTRSVGPLARMWGPADAS